MPAGDSELLQKIEEFISDLKQGSVQGYHCAYRTATLMRNVISGSRWTSAGELLEIVREEGKKLIAAESSESAVGNIVRRVMKIIREEYADLKDCNDAQADQPSSQNSQMEHQESLDDFSSPTLNLKTTMIEAVNELIMDLENSNSNIAALALEYIHSNEVILTAGRSRTVETFLMKAAKKRKFQVIVVESGPFSHGQQLAVSLAKAQIETTVISDAEVFGIMSRVHKVIMGTHAIMADGGLKAASGAHNITLAAKHHSVPVIVCAAMFKLSPLYTSSCDQSDLHTFVSPEQVLNFSEGEIVSQTQIHNPVFDCVPPELVTLFVSNIGGNVPSYMYHLLSELYHPDDHQM